MNKEQIQAYLEAGRQAEQDKDSYNINHTQIALEEYTGVRACDCEGIECPLIGAQVAISEEYLEFIETGENVERSAMFIYNVVTDPATKHKSR